MKVNPVSSSPVSFTRSLEPWMVTAAKISVLAIVLVSLYLIKKQFFTTGDGTLKSVPLPPVKVEPISSPPKSNSIVYQSPRKVVAKAPPTTPKKTAHATTIPTTPMTPNTQQRNDGIEWIKSLVTNPPPIAKYPVHFGQDDTLFDLTEELLQQLDNFFANFTQDSSWDEIIIQDPYLFCELLKQQPKAYQWRDAKDKQRIKKMLESFEDAKAVAMSYPDLKERFYVTFPVSFKKLDEINQFLTRALAVNDNKTTWMQENYTDEIDDPFYWCDYLEKNHRNSPEDGDLKVVLENYNKLRKEWSKVPELLAYFYMDPFEVVSGKYTYQVDWSLLTQIKISLTRDQTKISDDYIRICESLKNNPEVYWDRPEALREFIESITKLYHNKRHQLSHH